MRANKHSGNIKEIFLLGKIFENEGITIKVILKK
jgi:hypothetical protein